MRLDVIESLEQAAREKQHSRMVHRLADALMVSFGIPEGNTLVSILGHGDERNNQEAMRSWVSLALQNPDLPMAVSALPHLVRRLETNLADLEGMQWA